MVSEKCGVASEVYNVTSTLSEIKDASLGPKFIRFYYPESDGETMSSLIKKVTFKTNDVTRKKNRRSIQRSSKR